MSAGENLPVASTAGGVRDGPRLLPWAAVILVLTAYGWIATLGTGRFDFRTKKENLYTDLVEAFAAGQLHLQNAPPPELLRLPDPYDPAQNGGYRYLDASLYRGKYFVYFGVTPVFIWLWPYYAVTGHHPPDGLSVLIFCSAAFLTGTLLIDRLRRAHFPELRSSAQALAVLAWGWGNFYGVLLAHHDFFEIAVACGAFCLVVMLFLLQAVVISSGDSIAVMAVASAAYGLAIGSRPNLVFTGVAFALVLGFRRWRRGRIEWRLWCAAALPAAIILCGLATYNYLRFGDPREFGLHYQLTVSDRPHWAAFSWAYAAFNAYYYLISVPRLSVYFPFILEPAASGGIPPAGHEGVHYVVGSLWACPLVIFALAALWPARAGRRKGSEFQVFSLVLLCTFLATGVVLLGIGFCSYRYMNELQAPLLLLALAGWMAIGSTFTRPWLRGGWAVVAGLLVIWTGAVNFLLSLDVEDMFRANSPTRYGEVERLMNRGMASVAEALGWRPTRPVITLRFPASRIGTVEPLLVTGSPPASDFFYVYYTTPQDVQIGFESMGRGGAVSNLIRVDYAATHQLEIEGGLFLPPVGHPWLEKRAGARSAVLRHSLVVELDGKTVIDAYADFYPTKGHLSFGRSDADAAFGTQFTGPLFHVAWIPARTTFTERRFHRGDYGAVTLTATFPERAGSGTEPLLATGSRNRAHLVTATYLGENRVRIGLLGSGRPDVESAPLDLGPNRTARITIALGALYPTADSPLWRQGKAAAAADRLEDYRIEWNGRVVLEGKGAFYPAPPATVVVGENTVGFSGVAPVFGGRMTLTARLW